MQPRWYCDFGFLYFPWPLALHARSWLLAARGASIRQVLLRQMQLRPGADPIWTVNDQTPEARGRLVSTPKADTVAVPSNPKKWAYHVQRMTSAAEETSAARVQCRMAGSVMAGSSARGLRLVPMIRSALQDRSAARTLPYLSDGSTLPVSYARYRARLISIVHRQPNAKVEGIVGYGRAPSVLRTFRARAETV